MLFKRFGEKLKSLFGGRKIDEEFFDELEDTLIEGDLGARLTDEIITELRETARREKITEAGDLQARIQLDIHANRLGMRIVKQQMGSDPGAVIYDAITSAEAHGDELILLDTAGRMHNKENLMKELQKMDKVIHARGVADECYKKFLVIDATTGQNGVSQAMLFNEAVKLDGVILTKYDSAAKGGSLLQIGRLLNLPVLFVCVGEGYDDIRPFDKDEFITALMGLE